jgi:hypothetical protein
MSSYRGKPVAVGDVPQFGDAAVKKKDMASDVLVDVRGEPLVTSMVRLFNAGGFSQEHIARD